MKLRTLLLAAGTTATLFAQAKARDEVLERGRERILAVIEKLASYTCTETVNRQEFAQTVPRLPQGSCDQIDANRKNGLSHMELVREDRLRLDVEVTDQGDELYSWPGSSRIASEHVQDFAGEGVFQTGAFGPFLINVFSIPGVRFWSEGTTRINGQEVRQYRYLVPMEASHYRIAAGGATRVVPYDGRFWLDPETGDLRRLLVRTGELSRSTGNCEAATTVDFGLMRIGGHESLVSQKSVLHVVRRDAVEEENVTTYSGCHEFLGESTVHFGDTAAAGGKAEAPGAVAKTAESKGRKKSFPPGVRLTIRFEAAIDSTTSAAGDLVAAVARQKESRPKRQVLPDAGAPLRCRLTRLENNFRTAHMNVSIACDAVELSGQWIPFAAVTDKPLDLLDAMKKKGTDDVTVTRGRRSSARGATFAFPMEGTRTVVGPFSSEWISTVPKGSAGN
jgi:hypothetical protein